MATQTEYAWAAGFFDGEGCVGISKDHRFDSPYYNLVVNITQKDIRPLERFRAIFGVKHKIRVASRTMRGKSYSFHSLAITANEGARVLSLMLPYLCLKREVAEVGIEFQASVRKFTQKQRNAGIPMHELEYRATLKARVEWLNRGRWTAATTKPDGRASGCDSLDCADGKGIETAETSVRPN